MKSMTGRWKFGKKGPRWVWKRRKVKKMTPDRLLGSRESTSQ